MFGNYGTGRWNMMSLVDHGIAFPFPPHICQEKVQHRPFHCVGFSKVAQVCHSEAKKAVKISHHERRSAILTFLIPCYISHCSFYLSQGQMLCDCTLTCKFLVCFNWFFGGVFFIIVVFVIKKIYQLLLASWIPQCHLFLSGLKYWCKQSIKFFIIMMSLDFSVIYFTIFHRYSSPLFQLYQEFS